VRRIELSYLYLVPEVAVLRAVPALSFSILKPKIHLYNIYKLSKPPETGARGSVVSSGSMLQAGRSRIQFPM
jgi:hypothetical protein